MAFSFNFDLQIKTGEPDNEDTTQKEEAHEAKQVISTDTTKEGPEKVKASKEHGPPLDYQSLLENTVCETFSLGTLPPIHYLNESVFEQTASELIDSEKILSQTAAQHTDLISGVYEGGLKIWECTYDLLEYLESEGEVFSGKTVLDLGCGAGLLGILALKRGAHEVHFQDYNSTVIERLTVPNVLLNCECDDDSDEQDHEKVGEKDGSPSAKRRATDPPQHAKIAKCRFFSGDWTSFLPLMLSSDPPPKYDLIFTSETIYNTAYYSALHEVFHRLLAEDGLVYLATKAHYFGVGGGLYLFQSFVEEKDIFKMKCLKNVEQGLQRHVVSLTFKKSDKPLTV
ncbi:histidine protein methyltransferase 1 homolog isoform X1 [Megalops cyprinoides]|uniref:histidine protein methyltransferase 1 homolog isoform X1 n=1 Tax=Megalops cyprinoides TaxID=118141 RepID=UPI001865558A|nr:histidine protein methyltransferase 1 homolog isoform X1 [Megalops cyprinoides]